MGKCHDGALEEFHQGNTHFVCGCERQAQQLLTEMHNITRENEKEKVELSKNLEFMQGEVNELKHNMKSCQQRKTA